MNNRVATAPRQIDWNDVEGLEELLPIQMKPDDPTLAVHTLHGMFADPPLPLPAPTPTPIEPAAFLSDGSLELASAADYFGEDAGFDDEGEEFEPIETPAEPSSESEDLVWVGSETQQAALAFQRFADKFHAYAVTCLP